MKNKILVVEDEKAISDLICMNLSAAGYELMTAFTGTEAEAAAVNETDIDLALVDVMLPGKDGFAIMDVLKKCGIPVIFLTARADVVSKVSGLKLGAEDYMVKPFEMLELLVRMEKILERTGKQKTELTFGEVTIDLSGHRVFKSGETISLKPMEYDLLVYLAKNKNRAVGREQLLDKIWGSDFYGETRTVDVHIGQLRKKLGLEQIIKTIPKLGYRLEDEG